MARTIREIADGMKADFVRSEALRTAFGLTAGYDPDGDAAARKRPTMTKTSAR